VFVFGVGDQLDTKLLDRLADDNGGARDYVREDEDIEVKTSDLFTKLSHPALTDLVVRVDGLEVRDLQPKRLPDLFRGGQLVLSGRYRGGGRKTIRLSGRIGAEAREITYEADFAEHDTRHDFVATLWAQRMIGQLLDAIRLAGQRPELVDEVRRLAKEFGIVTPFTSHLIVEEGMRLSGGAGGAASGREAPAGAPARDGRGDLPAEVGRASEAEQEAKQRLEKLGADSRGQAAVADSLAIARLRKDAYGGPAPAAAAVPTQRVGSRTFYLAGDRWIDRACGAEWPARARRVVAFSDEYFALLASHPDLKAAFALGTRVVLALGDDVFEVVPPEPR
jgi:Ca-activated chloride channel family protein